MRKSCASLVNQNSLALLLLLLFTCSAWAEENKSDAAQIDYQQKVQPLLTKYCSGCHSDADKEGGLSTESYQALHDGIKSKPVLLPGDEKGSLLIKVLNPEWENAMPPEGEPRPSDEEIALLRQWVATGARGPGGITPSRLKLNVPQLRAAQKEKPVTAIDCSKHGLLAVGRFEEILFFKTTPKTSLTGSPLSLAAPLFRIGELPGKVNAIDFSPDGSRVAIASGVSGRGGQITVFNFETQKKRNENPWSLRLDLRHSFFTCRRSIGNMQLR